MFYLQQDKLIFFPACIVFVYLWLCLENYMFLNANSFTFVSKTAMYKMGYT